MGTETQILVGQSTHNKSGRKFKDQKLKESAFIHCTDYVISEPSIGISPIWLPIMRPEIKRKKIVT